MRPEDDDIARLFKEALPSAPQEEASGKRVFYRLLLAQNEGRVDPLPNDDEDRRILKLRWLPIVVATTALASSVSFLLFTNGISRSKNASRASRRESVQASESKSRPVVAPRPDPAVSPPDPHPAAAPVAAEPRQSQQTPASQNAAEPDSLLILGPANNGAARVGQRAAFGNGRTAPSSDDPNRAQSTTAEAERSMEQALASRETYSDVSFAAEANYFQLNRAEYFVPVDFKIPGAQLATGENARRIFLDIIGDVTDIYGTHIQNFRETLDVRLSDETAKELPLRQIAFDTGFTLLPGKYSMKFLVHDRNTGRIGTYQTDIAVPNLLKPANTLPISSVALSTELINPDDALSNSLQPRSSPADSLLASDPLFVEGKKLIPSLTRTFSKRRELIALLQAYEPNTTSTEPLTAFVTFYRGQAKVFETQQLTFKDDLGRPWRTVPVKLRVPLSGLPAGQYDCEVTVIDTVTQKSAVSRQQIEIVD